jgi:tetratricopeptide (TPR) repeat protein
LAIDRTKVLEAAQKHLSKGVYDKAIVELQKLVKADPSDVRTWLKIGDLYVKLNQRPQAIDTYGRVAEQYAGQGFFHKAVAVYKQILNLDATRLDVKLKLAEMHESMQLTSDAMAAYEHVAAEYGRLGDAEKALSTFGKMVHLDPSNIPTRIKYAEALSRAGRNEDAAAAFDVGAELLKKQGRMDDYLKVVERLLFHREDVDRSRELAELYLERNDGKRALAKLQVLFKADPKHIPTLELLARAFEQVQQLPKTISVLREIARLHGDKGNVEERARALKRIVALDPGDPEARQALAQLATPARPSVPVKRDLVPPPGAVIEGSRSRRDAPETDELDADEVALEETSGVDEVVSYVDEDDDVIRPASEHPEPAGGSTRDDDLAQFDGVEEVTAGEAESSDVLIVEEEPVEEASDETMMAEPAWAGPSLPPDIAREAGIAKLMTEVEVFLRYGLKQKVVEQLRTVLALEPRHVEARERLKDILVERGETAAAADELVVLADQFADKPSVALLYLRQAREIDPQSHAVTARLEAFEVLAQSARVSSPPAALPTPVPPARDRSERELGASSPTNAQSPNASRDVPPQDVPPQAVPPQAVPLQAVLPPKSPEAPATKPQPVTSYLARKGAGISGPNAALGADGRPLEVKPAGTTGPHAALPPKPLVAAPLSTRLSGEAPRPVARPFAVPPAKSAAPEAPEPASARTVPIDPELALEPENASEHPATLAPAAAATFAPSGAPVGAPRSSAPPAAGGTSEEDGFFEDDRTMFGAPIPEAPGDAEPPTFFEDDRDAMAPELGIASTAQETAAPVAPTPGSARDLLAPISPEEFENVPVREGQPEESSPQRASLSPGEVEEILDEAEFFAAQGLYDEAVQVLRDALATHPGNRLLLDKIEEIEEQGARAEASIREASQVAPPVDNSFQLAEKLADELGAGAREGSDILDVERVFAQFKKGVEEQVAASDSDTHFDLGIAYKEMGLITDAIREFELCLANPSRECIAHTMIGLCHAEQGDFVAAVGAYKSGLYAEKKTEREETGLYFELGRAYRAMQDPQEALYYFEKVRKRDPSYLDVETQIDTLTTGDPAGEE